MKYFLVSFASILITISCCYLIFTNSALGSYSTHTNINNDNNPYVYKDSYYSYKNWNVKIGNISNYGNSSILAVTNTNNPVAITIEDNELGKMHRISLSNINNRMNNRNSICDIDNIHIFFNEENHVDKITLYSYENYQTPMSPMFRIKVQRKDGVWIITDKEKIDC